MRQLDERFAEINSCVQETRRHNTLEIESLESVSQEHPTDFTKPRQQLNDLQGL